MKNNKCKICRRLGVKLFLKGERCLSVKCSIIRKPYPPGQKKKRRARALSEYGQELREKQKMKNWYNLGERQFKNYVSKILKSRGKVKDPSSLLIKVLESRLDNVVFKLGFSSSRSLARQMVSHGHFLVNNKSLNIPSYLVKKGDKITLKPESAKKKVFQSISAVLKKYTAPAWLEINVDKLEGKVLRDPGPEDSTPPAEISSIFEFYSK
ncbi:MAG: 30S ribosomal protein S4 [Candidatus Nealsonbacteria bacterium]|nr:30S ribosomal protein S4 [Candidatus Nealsonbacteria bacterium]